MTQQQAIVIQKFLSEFPDIPVKTTIISKMQYMPKHWQDITIGGGYGLTTSASISYLHLKAIYDKFGYMGIVVSSMSEIAFVANLVLI